MKNHPTPVIERLLARIEIDEYGCWIWPGARTNPRPCDTEGYGRITLGRRAEGPAERRCRACHLGHA